MTKLDFSKPDQLQTRDGRPVRIYATDCGGAYPIHGAVPSPEGWESLRKRAAECVRAGLIKEFGTKKCSVTGQRATVYWFGQ